MEDQNIQRQIIEAAHQGQNRLINISKVRKSKELDFLTDLSYQYRNKITSPHATNENVDPKLTLQVVNDLTQEADNSIIYYQTQLKHNAQNLSQPIIKEYNKRINEFYTKTDEIIKLGGYLDAAIEPMTGPNLPMTINNLSQINFNGKNEEERDNSMVSMNGWANNFDYTPDVKVHKGYDYKSEGGENKTYLTQAVDVDMFSPTWSKYFDGKPYIMRNVVDGKNMVLNQENGRRYYRFYSEIDNTLLADGDIFEMYTTEVPEGMKFGDAFENAGITQESTIQPQYFLGGEVRDPKATTPGADKFDEMDTFTVELGKAGASDKLWKDKIRFIDAQAVLGNAALNSELSSEIEGLFAVGSGNPGVLYGYANNNLGIDLPVGFFESLTRSEKNYYNSLPGPQQAAYVGNRYKFNTVDGKTPVSLVNSQKAWFREQLNNKALDAKLNSSSSNNEPSFEKIVLDDKTKNGRNMINFLNEKSMPIPSYYSDTLGIDRWQAGMPAYIQKIPEGFKTLPEKVEGKLAEMLAEYSEAFAVKMRYYDRTRKG
jgi:hypothetical protein